MRKKSDRKGSIGSTGTATTPAVPEKISRRISRRTRRSPSPSPEPEPEPEPTTTEVPVPSNTDDNNEENNLQNDSNEDEKGLQQQAENQPDDQPPAGQSDDSDAAIEEPPVEERVVAKIRIKRLIRKSISDETPTTKERSRTRRSSRSEERLSTKDKSNNRRKSKELMAIIVHPPTIDEEEKMNENGGSNDNEQQEQQQQPPLTEFQKEISDIICIDNNESEQLQDTHAPINEEQQNVVVVPVVETEIEEINDPQIIMDTSDNNENTANDQSSPERKCIDKTIDISLSTNSGENTCEEDIKVKSPVQLVEDESKIVSDGCVNVNDETSENTNTTIEQEIISTGDITNNQSNDLTDDKNKDSIEDIQQETTPPIISTGHREKLRKTRKSQKNITTDENTVKPIVRKRKWLSNKTTENLPKILAISTDSLKDLISDVKPVPLCDVRLESSPEPEEIVEDKKTASPSLSPSPSQSSDQQLQQQQQQQSSSSQQQQQQIQQSQQSQSQPQHHEKQYREELYEMEKSQMYNMPQPPTATATTMNLQTSVSTTITLTKDSTERTVKRTFDTHPIPEQQQMKPIRKISIVNDKMQSRPSPPKFNITNILYITNLVRPFTVLQLKGLLARTGKIVDGGFWIDKIKSKCYVKYETEDEATETRHALHGVRWPTSNPKCLNVDFGSEQGMEKAIESTEEVVKHIDEQHRAGGIGVDTKLHSWEKIDLSERKEQVVRPVREWDLGKKDDLNKEKERNDQRERGERGERAERYRGNRDAELDRGNDGRRRMRSPLENRDRYRNSTSPNKKYGKKENEPPLRILDDLFRKTTSTPCIYWLPLTPEEIAIKNENRRKHMAEHQQRTEEMRKEREQREEQRRIREKEKQAEREKEREGRRGGGGGGGGGGDRDRDRDRRDNHSSERKKDRSRSRDRERNADRRRH